MKRKSLKGLTALLLTAVIIAGCSKDKETPENERVTVNFKAQVSQSANPVNAINRASNGNWNSGDAIGVYMLENGTTTVKDGAENRSYITSSGDGPFTSSTGQEITYPEYTTEKVDFIAYYPYSSAVTDFTYAVNITDQTSPESLDLLYAETATGQPGGYDKNTPTVNLGFDHKLTKFIIQTVAGNGLSDLRGMRVSINGMNTQAHFDLKTGTLSGATTTASITPVTVTDGGQYEAILLPATSLSGTNVEFTLNDETYVWEIPAGTKLEKGYEYTWTITVQKSPVGIIATINPWKTGGGSGSANN